MSNNSEEMSKAIDLLTESLAELKAISTNEGAFTREQARAIALEAYHRGQRDLASSLDTSHFEAEVDTYCGDLSITGSIEVNMPAFYWFERKHFNKHVSDVDLDIIINGADV